MECFALFFMIELTWSGSFLLFQSSAGALLSPDVFALSLQPETPDAVCMMKLASLLKVYTPKRKKKHDHIIKTEFLICILI